MQHSSPGTLQTVRQWQSEADQIREAGRPAGAHLAVWLLSALVVCLIGAAPFFEVDRVVSSHSGKIVSVEPVTTFQVLDPSLIRSVDVKEGQQVDKGQLLATLDPTFTAADVGQLRQQIASLDAEIARASAEQAKATFAPAAGTPLDQRPYMVLQKALFDQRAAEFAAQTRSFAEKTRTTQATVAKFQTDEDRYAEREKISHQIEDMRDTLYKSGASSLLNLLQANDSRLELMRTKEFGHNSLIEARHQLSALQADSDAYAQNWFTGVSQELVTAQNARDAAVAALLKASKHQDLVRLLAPDAAVVLSVSKLSVGSVLKQGDEVMTLVPLRSRMEAEIHLLARDIGFVRAGDAATLKIEAFNAFEHGTASGHLSWISEGTFSTDQDGKPVDAPFYKARVSIDALHFVDVPASFRLIPGMTMTADIHVGTRSVFKYVWGSFFRGIGDAMREP